MSMIKYELTPFHKGCVFRVIKMDSYQVCKEREPRVFVASNGVEVKSRHAPMLLSEGSGEVCLWGDSKSERHRKDYTTFHSNEERDNFMERVHVALKEWSENGGFPDIYPEGTFVYEV